MYFKRLEMHGFKSFAEPVVIEFHEGVTCIVGPNGSGKSNISDAIRWVLGEQSPKALRGGKMEEVIFNGTASRKSRGMAEVTLVIDNSTGILDIDYNEVAITRRMFRSGESEYLINNNQCRLRDIRELIMDTGIGVDGYSIIGQGKISDIVSNKPESRREIFEEAAGVVLYKSKKTDAERKLTSTNTNLERVNDIIGEIEGRIEGLRTDSTKAKEFLTLKDKYRDLEINITLKNIENITARNQIFLNDIKGFSKEIETLSENKRKVDETIAASREKNDALDKLANESHNKLLTLVDEINNITSKSRLDEERLGVIEKEKTRIASEIEVLSEKLKKEEHNSRELEKSKNEISSKLFMAKEKLQVKIKAYNEVTEKANITSEKIESGKNSLYELNSKIATKNSEIKSIESMKQALIKRRAQLNSDSLDTEKYNSDNDEKLSYMLASKKEIEEELIRVNEDEKKLLSQINIFTQEQKSLRIQIEDIKIRGSQMTTRKKTIEEMENNYEGYNYAVKYIMRSDLNGIRGVIAELMEVPVGFEVAVETALGSMMQNIVCENDDDAKAAVDKLKENKAGRLTFLPLASIRGKRGYLSSDITSHTGFKGIASDCIKFDEEYRTVFEYLLGRVAIVDNMNTAIRLSKIGAGGIRFVTLDGEIINASGSITGGKYKNKTANLLERKAEITKLENTIAELSQSLKDKTRKLGEALENSENLVKAKAENEKNVHDKEIRLVELNSEVTSLQSIIKSIAENKGKFDKELASIEKELNDADEMISKIQEDLLKSEEEIEKLHFETEEAMKDFDNLKEQVSFASEEITTTRIAANEWENKKENIETLIKRVTETEKDYSFQIETKERQLLKNDDERNNILFGNQGSQENAEALLEEKKNLEEYIERIAADKTRLGEDISATIKEQSSFGEKLNSYQDQKYQLEIKAAKNDTQLETLKDRLWEDFEVSYVQAMDLKRDDFVMSSSLKESREIRNRMRELGDVNVGAIKEYESVSERYKFLTEQRSDITIAMDELQHIIEDMDSTIKKKFKENFDQIVINFESIFKELFGGGHAELRMDNENNPLESGIDIIAQPPGKKLQNINLLSGGEKTMTAIALMFAVLKTKPTPFCILDEVEAALDDANIDRFSGYLRKFNDIQFALVTHQKATMEHADVLYGVTMPEQGISKVLSLRLGDDFEI